MDFASQIIKWYHQNKRPLPWRNTRDAYTIWLSEVILQQTRIEQGLPYFQQFITKYPTVFRLASAPEDEVLKLWQGLGYYSRARNMLATARQVVEIYEGKFPSTIAELGKLKGIGPYTAAAIASFAFNKPEPVVDGNVFRVLSRYLGIETEVNAPTARKIFTDAARELMDAKKPADFNQAIMEFGATCCKPQNPSCTDCVLAGSCYALAHKKVKELPRKKAGALQKHRYFNYLLIQTPKNQLFIRKRSHNDIWKNLYELPLIESKKNLEAAELLALDEIRELGGPKHFSLHPEPDEMKHLLTHQVIHARFWKLQLATGKIKTFMGANLLNIKELHEYAIPRILDIYLKKINLL